MAGESCIKHSECCDKRCHEKTVENGVEWKCGTCKTVGERCSNSFECCTLRCDVSKATKKEYRKNMMTHVANIYANSMGDSPMKHAQVVASRGAYNGAAQTDLEKPKTCLDWVD